MNFMNLIFFVMKQIGILGFQGAIVEHERQIKAIGHEPVIVKYPEQLEEIDGIILPGGESTTMGKILNRTGLMEPLRGKIQGGLPVWGTCAGMILLAKELVNDSVTHLGVMDIAVRRNAYGSQIDSFATKKVIPEIDSKEIELVFIRAPYITKVKEGVKVLCELDGHIVAAEEKNMLVTSFHPELTDNTAFLKYFVSRI
ncbi:MAG TPA: pyridoxal 5'-phosphate synthase glutaminase subunit PdxT [Candidatus Butyricimonas faecavium]|nr:pyridoxal 5'-phosphate synthase glutaminase subunit PdxT [Candidatus Butyricimonas faecavium]